MLDPRDEDHEHIDGCLCDVELTEFTDDEDLPETYGGLKEDTSMLEFADLNADGCDVDFTVDETDDEDLPEACGGIA